MKRSTKNKLKFAVGTMLIISESTTENFETFTTAYSINQSENEFFEESTATFYKMLQEIKKEMETDTEEYSIINKATEVLFSVYLETGNEFDACVIDENGIKRFKETRADYIRRIFKTVGSNIEKNIDLGTLEGKQIEKH